MKNFIFLILMSLFFTGCKQVATKENQDTSHESRPNFLFIFADDQTYRSIGGLNNTEVQTPTLDKLVEQGTVFTHCFNQGAWGGAVCVASRAMLNTGQYIYHAQQNIGESPLWAETFTKAGYETFLTGKWHNGDNTALKSFKYIKSIGKGMFETKGGMEGPGYHRPTPDNNSWKPWDRELEGHWTPPVRDMITDTTGNVFGEVYIPEKHTSELYADNAIEFLQTTARQSDNPFFMYVAFNAPHDPRQSPKEFVDRYPPGKIALPETFMPEHPFDQGDNRLRDEILAPFPRTEEVVKVHRGEYYAIISHMDEQIGRILEALKASGKADNTYVIFSADHGLAMGEHGLMGKQNQYDHSIRVPMIFMGPSIAKGRQVKSMVYIHSLFATTCEIAGIQVPPTVEFPSIKSLLHGETEGIHPFIYGSYRNFQRMARDEKYKLIVYPHVEEVQLFDLETDPLELQNLMGTPVGKTESDRLFGELKALQQMVGDTLKIEKFF